MKPLIRDEQRKETRVIPGEVEAEVRADIARIIREEANEYDGRIVVSPEEAALDLYLAGYRKVGQ